MRTFFVLLILSTNCYSSCWTVGDFKGHTAKAYDNYKPSPDGFGKRAFNLKILGKNSEVSSSQDMQCTQVGTYSIICLFSEEGRGTVETWSVEPETGIAFHTKSNSGFGQFDGASMLVGKII